MDNTNNDPENDLTALELRLRDWKPTRQGLDRDRMLFEAGRAAAGREAWGRVPLGAIAALVLVAVTLGVLCAREHGQRMALERQIAKESHVPSRPREEIELPPSLVVDHHPAPDSYLVLSRTILSGGPELPPSSVPDTTTLAPSTNIDAPLRVRGSSGLVNF